MKIHIGADHRGFELKNKLIKWLKEQNHDVSDCGNLTYNPEDDYPDFASKVAQAVQSSIFHPPSSTLQSLGILICGSGVGVSVMANRFKGIICALGFDLDQVTHARENDHINILSIPSDYVDFEKAKEMINAFLTAKPKSGEKYLRRLKKLDK